MLPDPFWQRVDKSAECWLWTGQRNTDGYGQYKVKGVRKMVHRLAYEELVGPIPNGLTLDHLCRTRNCVNPGHLEPITNAENILRGESFSAVNARKMTCSRGHPFTPENTRIENGWRRCRACANEYQQAWQRRTA